MLSVHDAIALPVWLRHLLYLAISMMSYPKDLLTLVLTAWTTPSLTMRVPGHDVPRRARDDPTEWGNPTIAAESPIDPDEQQALLDRAAAKRRRCSEPVQVAQLEAEVSRMQTELDCVIDETDHRILELEVENRRLKEAMADKRRARVVSVPESDDELLNCIYKESKRRKAEAVKAKETELTLVSTRPTHLPKALQAGA